MKDIRIKKLADFENPLVINKAKALAENEDEPEKQLEKLFYYVRDDIKFGFLKNGDLIKASEIIAAGIGQCNNKTTLFLALCRALNIPARMHFSLIKKEIHRGIFPDWLFWLIPKQLSHSWLEIEMKNGWRKVDTYINDKIFSENAKQMLKMKGWRTGYSIASLKSDSGLYLNLDGKQFEQMGAVTIDHGIWDEPMDYYKTDKYQNRPNFLKVFFYRWSVAYLNRRIEKIRALNNMS
jgi:hypothetical protein